MVTLVDGVGTPIEVGQVVAWVTLKFEHKISRKGVVRRIGSDWIGVDAIGEKCDWKWPEWIKTSFSIGYVRVHLHRLDCVTVTSLTEAELLQRFPLGPIEA